MTVPVNTRLPADFRIYRIDLNDNHRLFFERNKNRGRFFDQHSDLASALGSSGNPRSTPILRVREGWVKAPFSSRNARDGYRNPALRFEARPSPADADHGKIHRGFQDRRWNVLCAGTEGPGRIVGRWELPSSNKPVLI